jgi:hypothetical protein
MARTVEFFLQLNEPTKPVSRMVWSTGYGSIGARIDTAFPVPPMAMKLCPHAIDRIE